MASSAAAQNQTQAGLAVRHDDEGGEQRARRSAEIAADLEQRLREAVAAAGRHARHARGFRMKDRRAHADQRGREQDDRIGRRLGHQHRPTRVKPMPTISE